MSSNPINYLNIKNHHVPLDLQSIKRAMEHLFVKELDNQANNRLKAKDSLEQNCSSDNKDSDGRAS
jgi:hypothetical protein